MNTIWDNNAKKNKPIINNLSFPKYMTPIGYKPCMSFIEGGFMYSIISSDRFSIEDYAKGDYLYLVFNRGFV